MEKRVFKTKCFGFPMKYKAIAIKRVPNPNKREHVKFLSK